MQMIINSVVCFRPERYVKRRFEKGVHEFPVRKSARVKIEQLCREKSLQLKLHEKSP